MIPSILLIGCDGYLGSHLRSFLIRKYCIFGLDLHFRFDQLTQGIKEAQIVILALGLSDHLAGQKNPQLDFKRNLLDYMHILEHPEMHQKKILILGSICQYGLMKGDISEEYPMCPLEPQGLNKAYVEQYLGIISRTKSLSWLNLRLGAVTGGKLHCLNLSLLEKMVVEDLQGRAFDVYGGEDRCYPWLSIEEFLYTVEQILEQDFWPDRGLNCAYHTTKFKEFGQYLKLEFVSGRPQEAFSIQNERLLQALKLKIDSPSVQKTVERLKHEIRQFENL